MRLLDALAQATDPLVVDVPGHGRFDLPCAADAAPMIRATDLRYVLSNEVREACEEILARFPMVLDPGDPLLRLPNEAMWLEWAVPRADGDDFEGTVGVLVETDGAGRAGTMTSFWAPRGGTLERSQAAIVFDLDKCLCGAPPETLSRFSVRSEFPLLQHHAVVEIPPRWRSYFSAASARTPHARAEIAVKCGRALWHDFAFLLAFLRLLGARGCIDQMPVERSKLNKKRAGANRPLLLDYCELTIRIGEASAARQRIDGQSRSDSRRHLVRGHVVRRQGQIFWRSAHYRGTAAALLGMRRTGRVKMARGFQYTPDQLEAAE